MPRLTSRVALDRLGAALRAFDLQVNGYDGADFCSIDLSLEQCRRACRSLAEDGVDGILATIITDELGAMAAKLARLAEFRRTDPEVASMIHGFHIEGPFLNPAPGYIGAHPAQHTRPASRDDMQRLLDAGEGLVKVVTLAPECDPGLATTGYLASGGVTVSAGHCNPTLDELRAAIDAGLSMFTHLGNGCPVELPRHDNIIQRVLSLREQLWIGLIPDGAHVDFFALNNMLDLIGTDRAFMVTDAIAAARLGPGCHELSGFAVEVDEGGVARRPGSDNLAGSTITMPRVRQNLARHFGFDDATIDRLVAGNPRRAIGLDSSNSPD